MDINLLKHRLNIASYFVGISLLITGCGHSRLAIPVVNTTTSTPVTNSVNGHGTQDSSNATSPAEPTNNANSSAFSDGQTSVGPKPIQITNHMPLRIQGSPTTDGLTATTPDFLTVNIGYVGSKQGLLKTTDGGKTWTVLQTPPGTIEHVSFANTKSGWILVTRNNRETLYDTSSGGTDWVQQKQWPIPKGQSGTSEDTDLDVQSSTFVVVRAYGALDTTSDGGKTWRTVDVHGETVDGVDFTSPLTGVAVTTSKGNAGAPVVLSVWQTTDGGKRWTQKAQSTRGNWFGVQVAMHGVDGLVLAKDGSTFNELAFRTKNGGDTWTTGTVSHMEGREFPSKPVFGTGSIWVAVGGGAGPLPNALLSSVDGGKSFEDIQTATIWQGLYISRRFGDTAYGIAIAGNQQQLIKTTDGGRIWIPILPLPTPTENISFVSPTQGFGLGIATDPTAILHTSNAGHTWQIVGHTPTSTQPSAMSFTSANVGYVVMDQPHSPQLQVLKTTDGGQHWTAIRPGTLPPVTQSFFNQGALVDPVTIRAFTNNQIVVGASGYPELFTFSSNTGGERYNATSEMKSVPGSIDDYAFPSPTVGWMSMLTTAKSGTANGQTILYTLQTPSILATEQQWQATWKLPSTWGVQGMDWMNNTNGWLVVQAPWPSTQQKLIVLQTKDAGQTWTDFTSPQSTSLSVPAGLPGVFRVSFVNSSDGWLLTSQGLLQTTDGGEIWTWA